MKKIVLMSLLATAMLFNAGCTEDEVAAGAIGVIIGIGLGDGHDHHRPPPYHPRRPERYALQSHITLSATGLTDTQVMAEGSSQDSAAADFAFKYNISLEAAEKVQAAFDGVKTEGMRSFAKIGLGQKDVESLMRHSLPSSSAIKEMAEKLDMSEAQSRDFLVAMNREFEAQAADVTSPYWQACMAKGKWKTPQNLYCKTTSWSGCGPETGATLCY